MTALKLNPNGEVEPCRLILSTRDHTHLGQLTGIEELRTVQTLANGNECSFRVHKYLDKERQEINPLWDEITDFKYIFIPEMKDYLEIEMNLEDGDEVVKSVSAVSSSKTELSQSLIYRMEINTPDDIARDDYEDPTVFYDPDHPECSLLHRALDKLPHWKVEYVDESLRHLQRTFSVSNADVYTFFTQTVAEELDCLFQFDSINRTISVWDLKSVCLSCGHRGNDPHTCKECGSDVIKTYGKDMGVYIDKENIANSISFSTDVDQVKNCFRLEAGDDAMNAAVANRNPNGSMYIYYFSEDQKHDMPPELVEALEDYDELVASYDEEYAQLMLDIYNDIDQIEELENAMMPTYESHETTAEQEAAKITASELSPVGISRLSSSTSLATVTTAVKNRAKTLVHSGKYKVDCTGTLWNYIGEREDGVVEGTWEGSVTLTSYIEDEDTYTVSYTGITVWDKYADYVEQRIERILAEADDDTDGQIYDLLSVSDPEVYRSQLQYWCLERLQSFADALQSVLDVLIEVGQATTDSETYETLYEPYWQKLQYTNAEIDVRQGEIDEARATLETHQARQQEIQAELNFKDFLDERGEACGKDLYAIFCIFKREDVYSNSNYISDDLDNKELLENARVFIETAKEELVKSGEHQHTIEGSLNNFLAMPEFACVNGKVELGDFLHAKCDDPVYRLRLIYIAIDFSNLDDVDMQFSDMTKVHDGLSDIKSILDQANSMSSSYGGIVQQVKKNKEQNKMFVDFVDVGLDATNIKIVSNADNQNLVIDEHGLLAREYDNVLDEYDDKQIKLFSKGIYFTTDNWRTVKTGLGDFIYHDPETGELTEAYGVIAETVVGKIILGEEVGIYTENGRFKLDEDGFLMVCYVDEETDKTDMEFAIVRRKWDDEKEQDVDTDLIRVTDEAELIINSSSLKIQVGNSTQTLDEYVEDNSAGIDENEKQEIIDEAVEESKGYVDGVVDSMDIGNRNYLRDTRRMTGWVFSNLSQKGTSYEQTGWNFGDTDLSTNYIYIDTPDDTAAGTLLSETVYTMPGITYVEIVNSQMTLSWDICTSGSGGKTSPDSDEGYSFTFYLIPREKLENFTSLDEFPHSQPLSPDDLRAEYLWDRRHITFTMENDLFTENSGVPNLNDVVVMLIECRVKTTATRKPYCFRKLKLEKGNFATDWNTAQEDSEDKYDRDINDLIQKVNSCATMEMTEEAITTSVEDVYKYVDERTGELSDELLTQSTTITQTSEKVETVIKDVNDISSHFTFTVDGFYINKDTTNPEDNPGVYMFIDNDSLEIRDSSTNEAMASFTESKMTTTEVVVKNALSFENGWAFIPRGNGSMDFKKIS